MKHKFITKLLSIGALLNSFILSPVALSNSLPYNDRYQHFNSDMITIKDIIESERVKTEINGYTLVNLLGSQGRATTRIHNRNNVNRIFENVELKKNSTYTLFAEAENFSGTESALLKLNYRNIKEDGTTQGIYPNGHASKNVIGNRLMKLVFTTGDLAGNSRLAVYVDHIDNSSSSVSTEFSFDLSECMLLEGDWTNIVKPDYFDGVKHVDNIGFNVVSKNLFDISKWKNCSFLSGTTTTTSWNGDSLTINALVFDSFIETGVITPGQTLWNPSRDLAIKVKPNTTYTLSFDRVSNGTQGFTSYISLINASNQCVELINTVDATSTTFTTTDDTRYITFRLGIVGAGNYATYSNIQLEENSTRTAYVPYNLQTNSISSNNPLKSTPNGICDRVVRKNGQWMIERNVGEVTLNGSENWTLVTVDGEIQSTTTDRYVLSMSHFPNIKNDDISVSTEANLISSSYGVYPLNTILQTNTIGIGASSSYFSIRDVYMSLDDFKTKLSNNNLKVVYPLKTPTYEVITGDFSVVLPEGVTHINTASTIANNIKITVDRALNLAIYCTELAKTNPSIDNISQARYWTNLVKESSRKDSIQSDINSLNASGLSIDKSITSSNSDIYIKGKNTLSMSLDTNYIVFDEFDSVDNMEKINALEISIDSSLPYDMFTHLESNIQNQDSSNILSNLILDIKENSENDYQNFSTSNKILLKSNCSAGKNIKHNIDLRLNGGYINKSDVYKTTLKFEVVQK